MDRVYIAQLIDQAADPAFAVDQHGLIGAWNERASSFFGYGETEALREPCCRLLQCSAATRSRQGGWQCGTISDARVGVRVPGFDMEVRTRAGAACRINVSILTFRIAHSSDVLVLHLARESGRGREAETLLHQVKALMERYYDVPAGIAKDDADGPALTEQERNVLMALSCGKNAGEVGRDLNITHGTLRNHLHHINKKLGTRNRLEAVVCARQRNLV